MLRYFMEFSYDGTRYHGWQIQPGQPTVQEVMTEVFRRIFGQEFSLTAAGRTDAGVHARQMVAHFDTEVRIDDLPAMAGRLSGMLPADIAVHSLRPVRADAHARFDAISRTYEYHFSLEKDPFTQRYATFLAHCPDVALMNEGARVLLEYCDFTSFSKLHTDVKTNNCRIMQARWELRGQELVFTIQSDRFLRNMVRAIVGTMLELGRKKIDVAGFRQIIERKDRCEAGTSVPAQGLFLTRVEYPENVYLK